MEDAFDIIDGFHKKPEPSPKFCSRCKGQMMKSGRRTSSSVNYGIWSCVKCGNEETQLLGLDKQAKEVIDQINKQVK